MSVKIQVDPHKELWLGVKTLGMVRPRALRWRQVYNSKDIAFTRSQAMEFYQPSIDRDTISSCMGSHNIKVNPYLSYEMRVNSSLYWIKPRRIMAIRVTWETKRITREVRKYSRTGSAPTAEILTSSENTWFYERFYERYAYSSRFRWCEYDKRNGEQLIENYKLLQALHF